MKDVSLPELLKSGAHFGHQTSRWNPKMRPYIFTVRNNIHIMDLEKTRAKLLDAMTFSKEVAAKGGYVLFVGTKRQSKDAVKAAAISAGMPYVITRWLGGTFTNFRTIQKSIKKMEKYENLKATGEMEKNYTKKEGLMMERELTKMKTLFEGIKDLRKLPEAVVIFDVKHDEIALTEAQKSKVKIIAVVDTNGSPDKIDYVIPANDDAIKAVELVANALADAIIDGKNSFVPVNAPINAVNTPKPAPVAAKEAPATEAAK
ncbi:MAG: rpsB [Candidatus Doudnabacteria bacterium]|nr:rpsB [Candidatus Doudnabacteria bacterium]